MLAEALNVYLSTCPTASTARHALTVVATVFLPLTFVAGFFGKNFGWLVRHVNTFERLPALGHRRRASSPALVDRAGALAGWLRRPAMPTSVGSPMAVDLTQVSNVDAEPGELPETMAAWVIRQEREGEPMDAFQVEEIEVPEPGAFEVIVRVMAAGVNFNNVWAALGQPVSVFGYGDHPEYGHHIGGSDASGVVWKVGPGVTRWKPGDEVVIHCNQASYEDPEVHGLDPLAAPSQQIWGYETTLGLVRPVHEGPGPAAAAQAQAPDLGGGGLLRADLLHRLPHADGPREAAGRPPRAHLGRRRRPGRVRHAAVQGRGRAVRSASCPRAEKGELVKQLGADGLHRPQRVRRA